MISNGNWTSWIAKTSFAAVTWAGGAVFSYQQALGSIPKPPDNPRLADVMTWAVTGGDPTAIFAAIASGLGLIGTVYQLAQPKPYAAKQGLLDRQHQNKSFAAADNRAEARHDALMAELAGLKARFANDSAISATSAEAAIKTVTELATSGDAYDLAIAEQALRDDPQSAADALMAASRLDKSRAAERARQAARLYAPYAPSKAMAAYHEATELDPEDVWSWIELGRLRLQYVGLDDARACFGIALRRVNDERDRAALHDELGTIMIAEGQLGVARREYEAFLAISQRFAASDPSIAEWQRDLAVSYERLGNIDREMGDLASAKELFEKARGISMALVDSDPEDAGRQNDLAIIYEKRGELELEAGDLVAARAWLDGAISIAETLATRDPSNTCWQRSISVFYERLGDIEMKADKLAVAKSHYETSFSIAETLAAVEPDNTQWQHELSTRYSKLGDVEGESGNLEGAMVLFMASLNINEVLAAREPQNVDWQRSLFISHAKFGVLADMFGASTEALQSFRRGEAIMAKLAAKHPDHPGFIRDLALVRRDIGLLCE